MATGLVTSSDYLLHETGAFHPERPQRLRAIAHEIARHEALRALCLVEPRDATPDEIARVHGAAYIEEVRRISSEGGGALDIDTPISAASYRIALLSAGGGLAAVEAILAGQLTNAFVASRPPGHHARPNRGMGFCLFNNISVAARHARALGVERVAILDWDVHHGNGTQEAFYTDPSVFFCSLHQNPWYPFTGEADETGAGAGAGTNLNFPLRAGRRNADYLEVLDDHALPAIRAFGPDLILVSAGFDIHERDPLGEMRITSAGFHLLTQRVVDLAADLCDGRLVVLLEGGYDLVALSEGTANILHGLLGVAPTANGQR